MEIVAVVIVLLLIDLKLIKIIFWGEKIMFENECDPTRIEPNQTKPKRTDQTNVARMEIHSEWYIMQEPEDCI